MNSKLLGRSSEIERLTRAVKSDKSELIVVSGRRRIGKTFLIEQYFEKSFDFWYVGAHGVNTKNQLRLFAKKLKSYSHKPYVFQDWLDAFEALKDYLSTLPADRKRVVFIDEMPWMDTGRSGFVVALENFWNGWAMSQENVMLIVTGSATSWMRDKLVSNKGGLHARITESIDLLPFSLHETELYLRSRGIMWDRYQILQTYMLLGGVPFYYSILDPQLSLAQNIDKLCFARNGCLRMEFYELYNALFTNSELYIDVVRCLAKIKNGMTYQELSKTLKMDGGSLSKVLKNLIRCDFVECWAQFGNAKRLEIYRLVDFYTLFYFKFIDSNTTKDDKWWSNNMASPQVRAWLGISFELVCLRHHAQIKQALGISGVAAPISTWSCKPDSEKELPGAQVDMIIDRADRILHLCELKFSEAEYRITADYERRLRERMETFRLSTDTKKTIVNTFVTTYGVANGKHQSIVFNEAKMDDLFAF